MSKRILFLLLGIISMFAPEAQNITIKVTTNNVKEKSLRLFAVEDRVSLQEIFIEAQELHAQKSAEFLLTLPNTTEMILKIDMREFHFLAQPGNKYTINVLPFNDTIYNFDFKNVLEVDFTAQNSDLINSNIYYVDSVLETFLTQNHRMLLNKDSVTKNNFKVLQDTLLTQYQDNDYIKKYIIYEFASVYYGLNLKSKRSIEQDLFASQPILYDNIGYMDCLNTIFSHYFTKGYKYIKSSDIEYWLNTLNYNAFNDALGRDKILVNEPFRELVFLLGMKDVYMQGKYSRSRILSMLDKFYQTTKFEEHKSIAKRLIEYLQSKDFSGKKVNNYVLKDLSSQPLNLDKYMDKPLILCFVRLESSACLKELETIHYYYDSIKNNCNILTICCDNSFEKMYNFINNSKIGNKYKWSFAYFDYNWDMIEDYQIHFFPTFVLVNPDGTIGQNPLNFPSAGSLEKFKDKQQK